MSVTPAAELEQTLAAEARLLGQFTALLETEREALTVGNTEELPAIGEQKEKLAIELTAVARQRNALLASLGHAADRPGVEAWIARHPKNERAAGYWREILATAARAKEQSRVNGQLIELRMQYNRQALDILRRQDNALNLYGPDGRSAAPGDRRIDDAV